MTGIVAVVGVLLGGSIIALAANQLAATPNAAQVQYVDKTPVPVPTVTQTTLEPTGETLGETISMPSARRCVSRRTLTLRIAKRALKQGPRKRNGHRTRFIIRPTKVVVRLRGKVLKVMRGSRIRSLIVLRGLPKGRYTVSLEVRFRSGKRVTGARKYYTCRKKLPGRKRFPI